MTGKENAMEWIMILKAVLALAFVLGAVAADVMAVQIL